jgi:proline iminopeptidase
MLARFVALDAAFAAALVAWRVSKGTGATSNEVAARRPGDDIIPKPTTVWNRGATIAANPSEIWPWLVQMGFGRGGFYVPDWVDRLVWRVPAASAGSLLPEHAHNAIDDVIADGPQYLAYWRVKVVESERALVFWTRRHPWRGAPVDPGDVGALARRERELLEGGMYAECSWGFYLDQQSAGCTRLLIRTRAVSSPAWLRLLPYGLIDAYLSYAELRTIKRLVEAARKSPEPASAVARSLSATPKQHPAPVASVLSGAAGAGTRQEAIR